MPVANDPAEKLQSYAHPEKLVTTEWLAQHADDPGLVKPEKMVDTLRRYLEVFEVLEGNRAYVNLSPLCEPQLGKRGLYRPVGGQSHSLPNQMAMLWVLNLSDGEHNLLDIAERADMSVDVPSSSPNFTGVFTAPWITPQWIKCTDGMPPAWARAERVW